MLWYKIIRMSIILLLFMMKINV